ncbi:MAG: hypothetical protein M3R47_04260 [Chloroflexota bacterium]|nr:hypothetical protein [Chloroflexota bacterium]
MGAPDKWESARFTGFFLASSFSLLPNSIHAHPLAANASRWAVQNSLVGVKEMSEFLKSIETALEGAQFHEDRAFLLAYPSNERVSNESYKVLVYHLRAYFWELWSVWDYILQNANAQTLKLLRVDTGLIDHLLRKMSSYNFLPFLQSTRDSSQLKRLARLRHSAHRWILDPYLVGYNDTQVNVISLKMQDGEAPIQVNVDRNDLWFMSDTVNKLKDAGFFN